ncbi:SpoIIE family protein phosphatase [Conexibacter woesei]|uniref:SpoIIE family protein phosphatase n=1 Tax=Conexibacter woesei TaxID=191495 RepID=UPI0003FF045E|nr:SpoIIE family protein phosphatase [Conexibacter woesei]
MASEPVILLADDDDVGRYVIATMLRRAGFAVREAADGDQAVAEALQAPPDLAVLDVKMPGLNGFEACRRLKSSEPTRHIPVLLLSATFLETEAQVEGLETGADAYLTQPVEAPVLAATIRSLLRARSAEAEVRLAAREWRTTFDAITDAVAVLNADGAIERANRTFRALFGEAIDGTRIDALADPAAGDEVTLGDRVFRVRVDPVAPDPSDPASIARTVVTLSDVTASKLALATERTISRALQQSLLPERLPRRPELELHAWHVAAERELIVGGDWYDVVETEGSVWLVIADIAGHGVAAAAQAGQLRHSLRVYANEGFTPLETVHRLNELVTAAELTEMATMCVVAIDHDAERVRVVRAGHPPPLLLPGDGAPRLADGPTGVVLGVVGARCSEYEVPFRSGDRLVLYTDGLIERPGEIIDDSLARMVTAAAEAGGEELEELRGRLVRSLVDTSSLRDDVALLMARRR